MSVQVRGGGEGGQHQWSTPPPGTRSEHLPPPPPPGPGQNIYPPPPRDQVRTSTPPPPPGTRSEHLPPPLPPPTTRGRAVRILLECILVRVCSWLIYSHISGFWSLNHSKLGLESESDSVQCENFCIVQCNQLVCTLNQSQSGSRNVHKPLHVTLHHKATMPVILHGLMVVVTETIGIMLNQLWQEFADFWTSDDLVLRLVKCATKPIEDNSTIQDLHEIAGSPFTSAYCIISKYTFSTSVWRQTCVWTHFRHEMSKTASLLTTPWTMTVRCPSHNQHKWSFNAFISRHYKTNTTRLMGEGLIAGVELVMSTRMRWASGLLVGRRGRLGAEVWRRVLYEDRVAHVTDFRRTQVRSAVHILTHTVGAEHFTAVPAVVLQTKQNIWTENLNLLHLINLVWDWRGAPTFLLVTVKETLQLVHSSTSSSCCHLTSVSDDRIFSSWIWSNNQQPLPTLDCESFTCRDCEIYLQGLRAFYLQGFLHWCLCMNTSTQIYSPLFINPFIGIGVGVHTLTCRDWESLTKSLCTASLLSRSTCSDWTFALSDATSFSNLVWKTS